MAPPPPGSNDHSVRVKSVKVELQGEIQDTYLFTKDRGIKCCKVDISSEQSSMIDVPLNWRTKHGEELVLPKENYQMHDKNYKPDLKTRKGNITSLYLTNFIFFSSLSKQFY